MDKTLTKIPVIKIPPAIILKSNNSLFSSAWFVLNLVIMLGLILVKVYHKETKSKTARRPEKKPWKKAFKINGLLMNEDLAPTNCIVLIKNLLENTANLIVL